MKTEMVVEILVPLPRPRPSLPKPVAPPRPKLEPRCRNGHLLELYEEKGKEGEGKGKATRKRCRLCSRARQARYRERLRKELAELREWHNSAQSVTGPGTVEHGNGTERG